MPAATERALMVEFANFAEELADAARKEILPFWRTPSLQVESKLELGRPVAESPVTIADRNAETAMRRLIETKYPQHGIYGEELGSVRPDAEFCWVLDPIDGTKSFITGKPLFGTLIGLCHFGSPVLGVIDQCVLKERWVGQVGIGTTLNGELVRARGVEKLSEAMLNATTPHMFAPGFETDRFASVRDAVKRPLYGCDCYAYALVASGFGADLVVEADLGLYDYAALVPVLLGAGGKMTDWDGKELTIQNQASSRGRVVAAANAALHDAAVQLLRKPPSESVLKPHLRELAPYKPPLDGRNPKQHLLLDFNERTVAAPKHVTDAIHAYIDSERLQQYPAYGDLNVKIAAYAGVRPEECMFLNGSDQGIDMVIRSCCPQGSEVIIPSPTFAMYEQAAKTEGCVIKSPFFTREKGFPLEEVLAAVNPRTTLIVLCNPNNPTGTPIPREAILEIARKAPQVAVLVDECYYEFMPAAASVKDTVAEFPNIFITRTFSKTWGLPALRLGYLISAEANVRSLCSVRGPYDINQVAKVAIDAALASPQYMTDYVTEVNDQARPKFENFLRDEGIEFWPTMANFIFCYFRNPDELEGKLRKEGILVRPKKDENGVTGLRISFGTAAQMDRLIATLKELIKDGNYNAKRQKLSTL